MPRSDESSNRSHHAIREVAGADGRRWRVWAVYPDTRLADRRVRERRALVEGTPETPALQRRAEADRRVQHRGPPTPADLLPARWRGGWLVFEAVAAGERASPWDVEVRRLAPIPPCWDTCPDAELREHLALAQARLHPPEGRG